MTLQKKHSSNENIIYDFQQLIKTQNLNIALKTLQQFLKSCNFALGLVENLVFF